jgi:hypothetical protein
MPISHQHRTIFVHIPKTAGTSVEAVLGMHGDKRDIGIVPYFNQALDLEHLYGQQLQHMTALAIKTALRDDMVFDSYFKFTIVRDPWERLVSALAWTGQKWARGVELTVAEFEQQLRQVHSLILAARGAPVSMAAHFHPQYSYVFDGNETLMVDFVARYENLHADWQVICDRLGVRTPLPVRMRSHHKHYREYYTDETRRLVADMYARDVSLFGYEF